MKYEYPKTIAHAATILDKAYPRWWEKINISSLNMGHGYRCILGQLYICHSKGMGELFNLSIANEPFIKFGNDSIFGAAADKTMWEQEIHSRLIEPYNYEKIADKLQEVKLIFCHSFSWALEQMKLGKKVKRKTWKGYYYLEDSLTMKNNRGDEAVLHKYDILANDWDESMCIKLNEVLPGTNFRKNDGTILTKVGTTGFCGIDSKFNLFNFAKDTEVELV